MAILQLWVYGLTSFPQAVRARARCQFYRAITKYTEVWNIRPTKLDTPGYRLIRQMRTHWPLPRGSGARCQCGPQVSPDSVVLEPVTTTPNVADLPAATEPL